MRPSFRSNSQSSLVTPRILLLLPLGLAVFALTLQFTGRHPSTEIDIFELFNEKEFIRRSDKIPKLERQLRKSGLQSSYVPLRNKLPLPEGLDMEWDWPANATKPTPRIAFTVTTAESVDQIKLWMAYHRALGVSLFYLFVEGQAATPDAISELSADDPDVVIIPPDEKLKNYYSNSNIWNEHWLTAFFNKPCNHELFVRQSLNMAMGIELARAAGAQWILHIDTDELLYPAGTRDFSLQELLSSVPEDVDMLVFPNYESLAERTDVEDPFMEVSLFKRSYSHVQSKTYFADYSIVARGNPNYFTTYGNGKSAARIQDGLRPNGAHRWYNYNKEPKEWESEQAAVLHYTYNRFSDLKSRRDRCDCKPTKEDAERCFILPFDRLAFLEASLKNDDKLMKFFKERLVWDDKATVTELVNKGLFSRLYEPQIMIRGLKTRLKSSARADSEPERSVENSKLSEQQQPPPRLLVSPSPLSSSSSSSSSSSPPPLVQRSNKPQKIPSPKTSSFSRKGAIMTD